uniref:Uncharacterized protein n=1 Tax=Kalanchoe fedtschenkoi TaxID=63787 RepID=A0A7N1A1W8_KALFE
MQQDIIDHVADMVINPSTPDSFTDLKITSTRFPIHTNARFTARSFKHFPPDNLHFLANTAVTARSPV